MCVCVCVYFRSYTVKVIFLNDGRVVLSLDHSLRLIWVLNEGEPIVMVLDENYVIISWVLLTLLFLFSLILYNLFYFTFCMNFFNFGFLFLTM